MANKLDKIDYMILSALQRNGHLTTKELSQQVNLSTTPVFERIKRMEKDGIIKKYVAVLNMEKINYGFLVFCNVKLKHINHQIANDFTSAINALPQVAECYNISGEFDYLLKVHAANMKDYQHFILNVLGRLDSVGDIQSTFVLDTSKEEVGYQLPMGE